MNELTYKYLDGMQAINHFFEMLYTAIQDVMVKREDKPKALISKSGAWVWRSYRIDDYGELARGQYYFQISPNDDKILYSEDDELNHI